MYTRWGGFLDSIDRFDAEFFGISPREAAPTDPQQRLLLEVSYDAIDDAGMTLSALAGTRTGVFIGISSYDYGIVQMSDRDTIDAYTNHGVSLSLAANRISYFYNLVGPSLAVDSACSSSLVAIDLACQNLWKGTSDLALAGGVNVIVRPHASIGFSKASMLSPDGRCKSFDARANGFVRGEGAAVIVLKPLARALADGDHIHAVIRASAVNQDGRTDGIAVPSRASQEENLRDALRLADLPAESIQFVEAHGTGTPVGDPIEAAAIGAVYGVARRSGERCLIGSIKSNIGHLEAASGMAGLIKTVLCLQHRQIPPNLHFETPNPEIAFDDLRIEVAQTLKPWPDSHGTPLRAGINSFGFGGTNGHIIIEAAPEPGRAAAAPVADAEDTAWPLLLSARSEPALADVARSYLAAFGEGGLLRGAPLRDVCYTAAVKRSHHHFRLSLPARNAAEVQDQLEAYLRGETRPNSAVGRKSVESWRPVFICSGMGQQWWAMGRDLLEREQVYRRALEEVNDLYRDLSGWSLLDILRADEATSPIQETRYGQPAIFALQIGLAALWRSWGIEPAAVFGHSAGEMAAFAIAGVLSLEDAVLVTYHRSRLQHQTAGEGVMLAAGISPQEAMAMVDRHPQKTSIAAINGLSSITLSGDAAVLADIDKSLNEAGVFSRPLKVDVPFHSPRMERLRDELVECLRAIRPQPAAIPVYSTVTAAAVGGPEIDAEYWYRNVRDPVLFRDTVQKAIADGHRVFVELGAHPILRRDITACLGENALEGRVLPSIRRDEPERAAMLGTLGQLFCIGGETDWPKLFPADAMAVKLPPYPFQAEHHWRESTTLSNYRRGVFVHPLLGQRLQTAEPVWTAALDLSELNYLMDHRLGQASIFPGAGFVEMALVVARETFGAGPCVIEDFEFQKFLALDPAIASAAQIQFDPQAQEVEIFARAQTSADAPWEPHARGIIRKAGRPFGQRTTLDALRARSPETVGVGQFYRRLADAGYNYGPNFQGIAQLWTGNDGTFAAVRLPQGLQADNYQIHPALLDACFQTAVAALPASFWTDAKGKGYYPVTIERLRFHAPAGASAFAAASLTRFDATVLKADIAVFDAQGQRLLEVEGLVCRPSEQRVQRGFGTFYEYQWKLKQRQGETPRVSIHIPSPAALAPDLLTRGEQLWRRLDRARFETEFHARARTAAAAYIVRALRELGWAPACAGIPVDALATRLGLLPKYGRWLRLMLKELSPTELASTESPDRLWQTAWDAFPEGQVELSLFRICGENSCGRADRQGRSSGSHFPRGRTRDHRTPLSGLSDSACHQPARAGGHSRDRTPPATRQEPPGSRARRRHRRHEQLRAAGAAAPLRGICLHRHLLAFHGAGPAAFRPIPFPAMPATRP